MYCILSSTGSSVMEEPLKSFASEVREQLLHGLSDEAEDIRYCTTLCV